MEAADGLVQVAAQVVAGKVNLRDHAAGIVRIGPSDVASDATTREGTSWLCDCGPSPQPCPGRCLPHTLCTSPAITRDALVVAEVEVRIEAAEDAIPAVGTRLTNQPVGAHVPTFTCRKKGASPLSKKHANPSYAWAVNGSI